jgi:UPF0716 protein FxsA
VPVLGALVLYVVVEVAAAVAVALWIGVGWTLLALLGLSLLGALLLRREGVRAWRAFSGAVAEGRPPGREVLSGMIVLLGALLIIVPGFVTDVLALACLVPVTRRLIGRVVTGWALTRGRATVIRVRSSRAGSVTPDDRPGAGRVIEGEIEPPRDPREQ